MNGSASQIGVAVGRSLAAAAALHAFVVFVPVVSVQAGDPPRLGVNQILIEASEGAPAFNNGPILVGEGVSAVINSTVGQASLVLEGTPGVFVSSLQTFAETSSSEAAIADLDGDDDLDVFVVTSTAGALILENDGTGTLTLVRQIPGTFLGVALGDLDGDGRVDALVGASPSNRVLINQGDLNYQATVQSLGQSASGVALGDVDGDGVLDAATARLNSSIAIWLGAGEGSFVFDSGISFSASSVRLGDVDGDGALDLLAIGADTRVWLNDGHGGFSFTGQRLSRAAFDVDFGDLDGDGDIDVVTDRPWLNTGSGFFVESTPRLDARSARLVDVDGDDDLDVMTATPLGGRVWLNDGLGGLSDSGQRLGGLDRRLATGDLDGDGDPDAYGVRSPAADRLWLNGAPRWQWSWTPADGPDDGQLVTLMLDDGSLPAAEVEFQVEVQNVAPRIAVADQRIPITGALDVDLGLLVDPGDDGPWEISVDWGDDSPPTVVVRSEPGPLGTLVHDYTSTGRFRATATATEDNGYGPSSAASFVVDTGNRPPRVAVRHDPIAAAEGSVAWNGGTLFDPDGDPILLSASVGNAVVSTPQGLPATFASIGQQLGAPPNGGMDTGDLDGDGDVDAMVVGRLTVPQLWLNDGNGTFSARALPTDQQPQYITDRSVTLGDIDGDGDVDAIVTFSGSFRVWRQVSPLEFVAETPIANADLGRVELWDLDLDGDLDLVDSTSAWLNDGTGKFTDTRQDLHDPSPTYGIAAWAWGDLTGDQAPDLLQLGSWSASFLWVNDGRGFFSGVEFPPVANAESVELADLDGDSTRDVFIGRYNENLVWLNDGGGGFTDTGQLLGDLETVEVVLGDLDGDGDVDAVVADRVTQFSTLLQVWLNDGAARFHAAGPALAGAGPRGMVLVDVDGDQDADLIDPGDVFYTGMVWLNQSVGGWSWSQATTDGPEDSDRVHITATDPYGGEASVDFDLAVENVPPRATPPGSQTFDPGVAAAFALGAFHDPGDDGPWHVTVDWGDGSSHDTLEAPTDGPLPSLAHVFPALDAAFYTVTVTVVESGDAARGRVAFPVTLSGDAAPGLTVATHAVLVPEGSKAMMGGAWTDPELGPVTLEASIGAVAILRPAAPAASGLLADAPSLAAGLAGNDVALDDLDGDGDLDAFVVTSTGGRVWLGDGTGAFLDSGQQLGQLPGAGVALADMDADLDLDAVVVHAGAPAQVWNNDGTGRFTALLPLFGAEFGTQTRGVAVGDLDGDGDTDVVVAGGRVWLSHNDGSFSSSGQRLGAFDLALGDLDDDGDIDVVGAGTNGVGEVWLNNGFGWFVYGDSLNQAPDAHGSIVSLGDLDGDGDLDAYFANQGSEGQPLADTVWLNDGYAGFFDSGQRLGADAGADVVLADLDGDDDLDAFVVGAASDTVWVNDGDGLFTQGTQSLGSGGRLAAAMGDVDSDGDADMVVVGPVPPSFAVAGGGAVLLAGELSPGAWEWSFDTTDGPEESQDVILTLTDASGVRVVGSFFLDVQNVPPAFVSPSPPNALATTGRTTFVNIGGFADPGDDGPWRIEVDWGDGTTVDAFDVSAPGDLGAVAHRFARPGRLDVRVSATESGSGASGATVFGVTAGEFLAAPTSLGDVVADASASRAYVTDRAAGTVRVVDGLSRKVIATIGVGPAPRSLDLSADGTTLFVAVEGDPAIVLVDIPSLSVTGMVPLAAAPTTMARCGASGLFAGLESTPRQSVPIDTGTLEVGTSIGAVRVLGCDRYGERLLTYSATYFSVVPWDVSGPVALQQPSPSLFLGLDCPLDPWELRVVSAPDRPRLFVNSGACDQFPFGLRTWDYDERTLRYVETNRLSLGRPTRAIAVSPDGSRTFVAHESDPAAASGAGATHDPAFPDVHELDANTLSERARWSSGPVAPNGLAVDASGDLLYAVVGEGAQQLLQLVPLGDDLDADGFRQPIDCEDGDPGVGPRFSEINDGLDNQCPGDLGAGAVDEVSGTVRLDRSVDGSTMWMTWPVQLGATAYEVTWSSRPGFGDDCATAVTTEAFFDLGDAPQSVLYYLVRAAGPNTGSWGQDSAGVARAVTCAQ